MSNIVPLGSNAGSSNPVQQVSKNSNKTQALAVLQMQLFKMIALILDYALESRDNQLKDQMAEYHKLLKAAEQHAEAERAKAIAGIVSGCIQVVAGCTALYSAAKMGSVLKDSSKVTFQPKGQQTQPSSTQPSSTQAQTNQQSQQYVKDSSSSTTQTTKNIDSTKAVSKQKLKDTEADENPNADVDKQNSQSVSENKVNSAQKSASDEMPEHNRKLELQAQAIQSFARAASSWTDASGEMASAEYNLYSERTRAEAKRDSVLAGVDDSTLRLLSQVLDALYQIAQQVNSLENAMNQTLTR